MTVSTKKRQTSMGRIMMYLLSKVNSEIFWTSLAERSYPSQPKFFTIHFRYSLNDEYMIRTLSNGIAYRNTSIFFWRQKSTFFWYFFVKVLSISQKQIYVFFYAHNLVIAFSFFDVIINWRCLNFFKDNF